MAALDTRAEEHRIADAGAPIPPLTDVEHWLLRIARAGLWDTSDMAHHTGLPQAHVRAALDSTISKLGAHSLSEAIAVAETGGILRVRTPPLARPRRTAVS